MSKNNQPYLYYIVVNKQIFNFLKGRDFNDNQIN